MKMLSLHMKVMFHNLRTTWDNYLVSARFVKKVNEVRKGRITTAKQLIEFGRSRRMPFDCSPFFADLCAFSFRC